jgi:Iap family predicted aminopeptidase
MNLFKSICLSLIFVASSYAQSDLQNHVTILSKEPRVSGTSRCNESRDYLKGELETLGYIVSYQDFTVNKSKASNILTSKSGAVKGILVIGAHYDTVPSSPGADDNASGVAVVLQLAKRLKDAPTRHTIAFQLYAGEEEGLIGFHYYVLHPQWPIKEHLFMLNLDMIGYYKPGMKFTFKNDDGSDQVYFREAGVPEMFLHTGLHRYYHKSTDTAEKLNYGGMQTVSDYAYGLIISLDKKNVPNYDFLQRVPTQRVPR